MSNTPKILVLTNVMPGSFGVGSIYLRDLFSDYPPDKLCFFSVEQIPTIEDKKKWSCSFSIPPPGRIKLNAATYGFSEAVLSSTDKLGLLSSVFKDIKTFSEKEKPDVFVAVLFGNWVVRNAAILQKELGLPLVSLIWDPPEYLAHFRKLSGLGKSMLLNSFHSALRSSSAICFPSHAMMSHYSISKRTPSAVLVHAIDKADFRFPSIATSEKESVFRIAFSGSMYAKENWNCLFAALDKLDWKLMKMPVEIVCMGNYLAFDWFVKPVNIRILGYRSFTDQLDTLSHSNFAYLPYWFRPEHSDTAKYSFPNKLSIYFAACCPVLFHGPSYSSITTAGHLKGIGPECHSLDTSEMVACLESFAETPPHLYQNRVMQLRDLEFNACVFKKRFLSMIHRALVFVVC